jgi:hypothetical protein
MQNAITQLEERVEELESKVSHLESELDTARRHALNVGSLAFRLAKLVEKPDATELQKVLGELEDYR